MKCVVNARDGLDVISCARIQLSVINIESYWAIFFPNDDDIWAKGIQSYLL